MNITPAIHGQVTWTSDQSETKMGTPPDLKSGDCQIWQRQAFAECGTTSVCESSSNTTAAGVFGKFYTVPNASNQELQSLSPAAQVCLLNLSNTNTLKQVSGEFIIVAWDQKERILTLITDHAATKPLYYMSNDSGVRFATDMESLIPYCRSPDSLFEERLVDYLLGRGNSAPGRTMINEIHQVPPATIVTITPSQTKSTEYWRLEDAPKLKFKSREDCYTQARKILIRAIERRTPDDENFACHLSGGLDSSIISAVASKYRRNKGLTPPQVYAWQPAAKPGEQPTIDQKMFKLCCEEFALTGTHIPQTSDNLMKHLQLDPTRTPLNSVLALEMDVMAVAQKSNIHTILSGWGGDQLFSFSGRSAKLSNYPRFVAKALRSNFLLHRQIKPNYLLGKFASETRFRAFLNDLSSRTTRQAQLSIWQTGFSARRTDCWSVFGAHHDIQYSYPMLDRELITFALGVPAEYYLSDQKSRNLMREAMRGSVSDAIRLESENDEISRLDNSRVAYDRGLEWCLEQFENGNINKNRANWFDLQKVTTDLKQIIRSNDTNYGRIVKTLSFLLSSYNDEQIQNLENKRDA